MGESEKRKRGGQPLNTNALKHGADLDEAKRTVRATRDRHRKAAEREARDVLRRAGLADDPLARLVAKQLRRLETIAGRLESFLERRGFFKRGGEPQPAVGRLVDVVDRLLGEARRLLEGLHSRGGGPGLRIEDLVGDPVEVEERVLPVSDGASDGAPAPSAAVSGEATAPNPSPPLDRPRPPVSPPPAPATPPPRPAASVTVGEVTDEGSQGYRRFPGSGWESDWEDTWH